MEEAGKGGGTGQTRPLSRGSSEVSVELELSSPIKKEKGQNCHRFVSKLHYRVDGFIFIYVEVVLFSNVSKHRLTKQFVSCSASSICLCICCLCMVKSYRC